MGSSEKLCHIKYWPFYFHRRPVGLDFIPILTLEIYSGMSCSTNLMKNNGLNIHQLTVFHTLSKNMCVVYCCKKTIIFVLFLCLHFLQKHRCANLKIIAKFQLVYFFFLVIRLARIQVCAKCPQNLMHTKLDPANLHDFTVLILNGNWHWEQQQSAKTPWCRRAIWKKLN